MCKDMELREHIEHLRSNQIRRSGAQKVGYSVGEIGMDCAEKYVLYQACDSEGSHKSILAFIKTALMGETSRMAVVKDLSEPRREILLRTQHKGSHAGVARRGRR